MLFQSRLRAAGGMLAPLKPIRAYYMLPEDTLVGF